jgi:hypothetical protein
VIDFGPQAASDSATSVTNRNKKKFLGFILGLLVASLS